MDEPKPEPGFSKSYLWEIYYRQRLETRAAHKGIKRLKAKLGAAREELASMPPVESIRWSERIYYFALGMIGLVVIEKADMFIRAMFAP